MCSTCDRNIIIEQGSGLVSSRHCGQIINSHQSYNIVGHRPPAFIPASNRSHHLFSGADLQLTTVKKLTSTHSAPPKQISRLTSSREKTKTKNKQSVWQDLTFDALVTQYNCVKSSPFIQHLKLLKALYMTWQLNLVQKPFAISSEEAGLFVSS